MSTRFTAQEPQQRGNTHLDRLSVWKAVSSKGASLPVDGSMGARISNALSRHATVRVRVRIASCLLRGAMVNSAPSLKT